MRCSPTNATSPCWGPQAGEGQPVPPCVLGASAAPKTSESIMHHLPLCHRRFSASEKQRAGGWYGVQVRWLEALMTILKGCARPATGLGTAAWISQNARMAEAGWCLWRPSGPTPAQLLCLSGPRESKA